MLASVACRRRFASTAVAPALRDQLRAGDIDSYLCASSMPSAARASVFAMRVLNLEVASVKDAARGNHMTGKLRLQFWRDVIDAAFEGRPHPHPLWQPLHQAVVDHGHAKRFVSRLVDAREDDLVNPPPRALSDLEAYAEQTQSSLLYLALEAVGVRDAAADHVASHVGKAAGLVTAIRGLPIHAALNQRYLPDDLMMQHQLTDGDVGVYYHAVAQAAKNDTDAPPPNDDVGKRITDAVFDVACTADAHLRHAADLSKDVPAAAIPALMFADPVAYYLDALQAAGFNPADSTLFSRSYLGLWFRLFRLTWSGQFMHDRPDA